MRLHGTNRVMLMVHTDCGAYGGLQAFGGNEEREAANHESELRSAAEFLKSNIPPIAIDVLLPEVHRRLGARSRVNCSYRREPP